MTLGLLPEFNNTAALRYFYEVARYGSFRLAADKIHIAASAISRQIQLLEHELGAKLFERDRKGLRLTSAGEALLYRVRRAMNELAAAKSEIETLQGSCQGTVRLGINETVAREFITGFLAQFRKAYPEMNFEIIVANTDELAAVLVRGELDIIIGYAAALTAGIKQVVSFDLTTCITVRTDHPLAKRSSVKISDIVDETFIMPCSNSMLRQVLMAIFARAAVKPASTITTNSFELMASLVTSGFGISGQVRLSAGPDAVRPEIVYVPIRDAEVRPSLLACCIRADSTPSVAVSLCIQELRQALQSWSHQPPAPTIAKRPAMEPLATTAALRRRDDARSFRGRRRIN
jgi:DNA-binding transcriptional LysR family regulator